MNDLAEKALHGLAAGYRGVRDRPMRSLAAAGFVVACGVVVSGARVAAAGTNRPLTRWLGLEHSIAHRNLGWLAPTGLAVAIAVLVLLWLLAVEVVRRLRPPTTHVWWTATAWAAPFVVGPPLLDTTIYRYAAFGLLQRNGYSAYDVGPERLGSRTIVSAIDPAVRGTASSNGALGTLAQHLAVSVSAGNVVISVLVLRLLAVLAAIAIGRLAAGLAATRPERALALTVLNPLLLLYVVSAGHLDGLMIALVLAALAAALRRRWLRAVVLGCLAGLVSAQAFVVVPVLVAAHFAARREAAAWRVLVRDGLAAGIVVTAIGFAVPDGFGWLGTVRAQFAVHTPFCVSDAVRKVLTPIVRGASYDDLAAGARITVLAALVCTVGYLVGTVRHRALDRTVGYALLATALLAPVLYPWYLLWGTLCLAPLATGARRIAVLALCAAGCLLAPQGLGTTATYALTGGWLLAVAAVAATALRRSPHTPTPGATPAPALSGAAG